MNLTIRNVMPAAHVAQNKYRAINVSSHQKVRNPKAMHELINDILPIVNQNNFSCLTALQVQSELMSQGFFANIGNVRQALHLLKSEGLVRSIPLPFGKRKPVYGYFILTPE